VELRKRFEKVILNEQCRFLDFARNDKTLFGHDRLSNLSMTLEPILIAQKSDFLVVAKPPHLLSHPTRPDGKPTLLGWLQEKFSGEFIALVNRLDRETSGTILVARSPEAASRLGTLTMRREIHKYYLALVSGRIEAEHGIIDAPIGRLGISAENPIWLRQGVITSDDPAQRKTAEARTEYWRLAASDSLSLLRLQAHTGRLHQLRVHLAHGRVTNLGQPDAGVAAKRRYHPLIKPGITALRQARGQRHK